MITQQDRLWIQSQFDKVNERLTEVRIEIAKLKVKSGVWGLIGGLIPTAVIGLYFILRTTP